MKVEIAARHGHLSLDHQAELVERAEKLIHYYDRLTYISVIVDLQHAEKSVEILCKCEHKHDFVGLGTGPDLIAAFGVAADKMKQQLKHHKERTQDHRRDPAHGGTTGVRT